jgi:hypothetical protein
MAPPLPKPDAETRRRIREMRANMPLRFEPADDRDGRRADFIALGDEYAVALAGSNARVAIGRTAERGPVILDIKLATAPVVGRGRNLQQGVTNYLIGNDPRQWQTGVTGYAQVEYHNVFRGVDVLYHGNRQRQLEYDFVVAPGASSRAISIAFDGITTARIAHDGSLVLTTASGDFVQHAPVIYQFNSDGTRKSVLGGYVRRGNSRFGFWIGKHDRQRPLVIDPVLTYATFLGGAKEERAGGVAIDAAGNVYITGMTASANFPLTATAPFVHGRDNADVFVVKLNAAGDQLLYATYIGGTQFEEPSDIAVDSAGNAYLVGTTQSFDFPTVHAIQPSLHGSSDGFVAKLDPAGGVVYSTYLGGNGDEAGDGIAVDQFGRAYVTGSTFSADFPTVNAMQPTIGGHTVFRTTDGGRTWSPSSSGLRAVGVGTLAIDPTTTSIMYAGTVSDGVFTSTDGGATWLSSSSGLPPGVINAIAVALDGTVYIANNFGLYRSRDRGVSWVGVQIGETVSAVVVDPVSGAVYAGLSTGTVGVFESVDGGNTWSSTGLQSQIFSLAISQSVLYAGTSTGVLKNVSGTGWQQTAPSDGHTNIQTGTSLSVNPRDANQLYAGTTSGLFYTTTGGSAWTSVPLWAGAPIRNVAMAPSSPSIVYVTSGVSSGVTDDGGATWRFTEAGNATYCFAVDPSVATTVYEGGALGDDVFISRISADGSLLEYSTYLGGSGSEGSSDIAIDATGAAYVAGSTGSSDFPTLNPFQPNPGGAGDVFVVKLSAAGSLLYGTYLGGSAADYMPRIAVDASAQAHVVGITLSRDFPVASAWQPTLGGGSDIFVTTLNAAGSGLVYSTYLGGSDQEVDGSGSLGPDVAIGPTGEAVVTGTTRSVDFPTLRAVQATYAGGATDAFVARYESTGRLAYSTYLGGSGDDSGRRVAVDSTGSAIVVGATTSVDFPTRSPLQSTNAGGADVFIARIDHGAPPLDTTPPTTHIAASGTAGLNGWYRSAVQISLTAVDDPGGSGVAFIEYSVGNSAFQRYSAPFSIAVQGTTTIHARATDFAANVENPGPTTVVSIDTNSPVIAIDSPVARAYLHSDVLQLSFAASDSASGVATGSPTGTLDGSAVTNGQTVQLLALPLGSHMFSASAVDQAGNAAAQTVSFQVIATIDSLIAAVNTFNSQGQIDPSMARNLQSKLSAAKQALDRGNASAARANLSDFADVVSAQSGARMSVAAAGVLLSDDQFVLGTM